MNLCCKNSGSVKLLHWGALNCKGRVSVEHCLAQIGQWQGEQARYIGLRKNRVDLRRMAVVHNLHVLAQIPRMNQTQKALS